MAKRVSRKVTKDNVDGSVEEPHVVAYIDIASWVIRRDGMHLARHLTSYDPNKIPEYIEKTLQCWPDLHSMSIWIAFEPNKKKKEK